MQVKLLWRVCLGLLLIGIAGGCDALNGKPEVNSNAAANAVQPIFAVKVGDADFTGSAGRQISDAYQPETTIKGLLAASGLVTFAGDGKSLETVNQISLSPGMAWQIQLNGKKAADLNAVVKREDTILITAEPLQDAEFQPVILTVNGGSSQPELTHSYVMPYTEDLTVRGMLKSSGLAHLAENNKTLLAVKEYKPLSNEEWKLKLNDKTLLDSGIDMKLRIQDKLEISLVLR
ncbi:hypothetical protein R70723_22570 [Paenibacillus sp. FSL R7-0273]|uniref:hypothetical protein n=1 Tax=Paenibacillus sp. FSL R7-0273 TaxID=1536772 RepID=UPI0004F7DC4B|nr:hypothetical protein [Paenibacillus sp. FSL R7-0273]AIQ48389.1 hypothetical protein R70723_22570 [Paenibacillus sp. FSL R7-0273]OMF88465.1 hypothetical protein BK144_21750 [Paenibacillus sp. FSL R7-0273]